MGLLVNVENISNEELRLIVDSYYQLQEYRKAADNQIRAITAGDKALPTVLSMISNSTGEIEKELKKVLSKYAVSTPTGKWASGICGIGPVITSGLLAHIDINKAPSVANVWSYAGISSHKQWEKGMKRPWNARLKVLCWKIGHSFTLTSSRDNDIYGHLLLERKQYEIANNEAGNLKHIAELSLTTKNYVKDTVAKSYYERGMLPPAHIHARAQRWAVKVFLAHFHAVLYYYTFGSMPSEPVLGLWDNNYIVIPNWDGPQIIGG